MLLQMHNHIERGSFSLLHMESPSQISTGHYCTPAQMTQITRASARENVKRKEAKKV